MAEKGYMIVADITGYTQYLSESELDHAQDILESLINSMLKNIHAPVIVARVEGDAIFAYTLTDCVLQGQTLLESLERVYFNFSHTLENNDRNTICSCKACANMNALDLKMVVHYGEFGLQKLGAQTELVGSDVNLTHRLLKNKVIEKTGVEAYVFFSQAAIKAMKLGDLTNLMTPHHETYEHLGEVQGHVYDLAPVWQRERERRRIYVMEEEADLAYEFNLPVPPMIAWDYLNEPQARARYRHSDKAKIDRRKDGRLDVGTVYHCVHGENVNFETVVDWKPFEYVTFDSRTEAFGFWSTSRITMYLEKVSEEQTQVRVRVIRPQAENKLKQVVMDQIWKSQLKQAYIEAGDAIPGEIEEMIKEDKESGRLSMRMIAAQA